MVKKKDVVFIDSNAFILDLRYQLGLEHFINKLEMEVIDPVEFLRRS